MLPTTTVNCIADELIAWARASRFGITDPSGVPVSLVYRCNDLARLPSGLQLEIVDKATSAITGRRAYRLLVFGVIAAFFVVLTALLMFDVPLLPAIIVAPVIVPTIQVIMVRREVKRIAKRVAAAWPLASGS